jgi:signal peptidase I
MQIQSEEFVSTMEKRRTEAGERNAVHVELAAELLGRLGEMRFVARGGSMLPTIYPGDCLTIKSIAWGEVRQGEIVLCQRNRTFVVHRVADIIEIEAAKLYVLRGDALTANDAPVPLNEILGRVDRVERRGKSFDPDKKLGISGRMIRAVLSNFGIVARFVVYWNNLLTKLHLRQSGLATHSGKEGAEWL